MRVIYLPLEPYPERYTELLTNWTNTRFAARGLDVETVVGTCLGSGGIGVGQVLDAHGRSYWALTQMAALIKLLREKPATWEDTIYFDDMFTPGFEALPYLFDQLGPRKRPQVVARNHAQSVDPDDFVFPMRKWMRPYETMVYEEATIVCASTVHKEAMEIAMLPHASSVRVLGLPYDIHDVRSRGPRIRPHNVKSWQVLYSSRFDKEKQPHFFLDVVDRVKHFEPRIEFVVCTGGAQLRSNDPEALPRLAKAPVRVITNCTKAQYYAILADSAVQLNTARQDYVSYTAIEASTFMVPTLAPAFRSFPEALRNNARWMYVPWSVEEAANKLIDLVSENGDPSEIEHLAREQHKTLDRIVDLFEELT